MKTSRILILLFILLLSSIANAQKMKDLYEYLITDYYNDLYAKNIISGQDTIYFTCGFCDYQSKCYDYDVELKNDKIQFTLPYVDTVHSEVIFYRLSAPELEKQSIIIDVGIYNMLYRGYNNKEFIYSGGIKYVFQYGKKKSQYVFKSKKEFGL